MTTEKRKGARRISEIPAETLQKINLGLIETANLMECLAIDFTILMKAALPDLPEASLDAMRQSVKLTWMAKTRLAVKLTYEHFGERIIEQLIDHQADNVRGWAAGVVAAIPGIPLKERLELIKPVADDKNSGTREMAWLLLRPQIAEDIEASINILSDWVYHESPNIRRFAVESTRPRGVWCSHINKLKEQPEIGLPILQPLCSDPTLYVQNSVGNWLNDAAKSKAEWVKELTEKWLQDNPSNRQTIYICKRAMRNQLKL